MSWSLDIVRRILGERFAAVPFDFLLRDEGADGGKTWADHLQGEVGTVSLKRLKKGTACQ